MRRHIYDVNSHTLRSGTVRLSKNKAQYVSEMRYNQLLD